MLPQTAPSSKLEEQAKSKGELSYSSWISQDGPANTELPPKKLSKAEVAQLAAERVASQNTATASAWNSAGTFEERCVTDWAQQLLRQRLVGVASADGAARVTAVSSLTGDAHIWFVRGKKRHGFEFDITLAWSSADDSTSGTVRLPSAAPDDLDDLDVVAQLDSQQEGSAIAATGAAALASARSLQQPLADALAAFYTELRKL